eukprot:TRINITY_DN7533_c0_g2_i1.p1 TRINITY_DN7533_c0_g2~~TRINITY_DN7533_c0_g2_i1.p1  ORF type:complete len:1181 (+),score=175.97 TRINITY_DN7533_c0_g2_i1:1123-4665(+)
MFNCSTNLGVLSEQTSAGCLLGYESNSSGDSDTESGHLSRVGANTGPSAASNRGASAGGGAGLDSTSGSGTAQSASAGGGLARGPTNYGRADISGWLTWRYVGIVAFLGLLLGGWMVVRQGKGSLAGPQHCIVIDSGSTGTRLYVYTWTDGGEGALPKIHVSTAAKEKGRAYTRKETEPGLDKFYNDKAGLRQVAIGPLLDWANEKVPRGMRSRTPIFLFGTAGLRRLPPEKSSWILEEVRNFLEDAPFRFERDWARIIAGVDEAVYGWIALNYLTGKLAPSHLQESRDDLGSVAQGTVGALDLGGSSLEVTFVPGAIPPAQFSTNVSLAGRNFNLYAHSHAGYGMNDAFDRSVMLLMLEDERGKGGKGREVLYVTGESQAQQGNEPESTIEAKSTMETESTRSPGRSDEGGTRRKMLRWVDGSAIGERRRVRGRRLKPDRDERVSVEAKEARFRGTGASREGGLNGRWLSSAQSASKALPLVSHPCLQQGYQHAYMRLTNGNSRLRQQMSKERVVVGAKDSTMKAAGGRRRQLMGVDSKPTGPADGQMQRLMGSLLTMGAGMQEVVDLQSQTSGGAAKKRKAPEISEAIEIELETSIGMLLEQHKEHSVSIIHDHERGSKITARAEPGERRRRIAEAHKEEDLPVPITGKERVDDQKQWSQEMEAGSGAEKGREAENNNDHRVEELLDRKTHSSSRHTKYNSRDVEKEGKLSNRETYSRKRQSKDQSTMRSSDDQVGFGDDEGTGDKANSTSSLLSASSLSSSLLYSSSSTSPSLLSSFRASGNPEDISSSPSNIDQVYTYSPSFLRKLEQQETKETETEQSQETLEREEAKVVAEKLTAEMKADEAQALRTPDSLLATEVQLVGAPDWDRCQQLVDRVITSPPSSSDQQETSPLCPLPPCALGAHQPSLRGKFVALAGFFVVYNFFGLSSEASLDELLAKGQTFCSRPWADVESESGSIRGVDRNCFRAPYIASLIRDGLHLSDDQVKVGSGDVGWTLGAAIYEGGKVTKVSPLLNGGERGEGGRHGVVGRMRGGDRAGSALEDEEQERWQGDEALIFVGLGMMVVIAGWSMRGWKSGGGRKGGLASAGGGGGLGRPTLLGSALGFILGGGASGGGSKGIPSGSDNGAAGAWGWGEQTSGGGSTGAWTAGYWLGWLQGATREGRGTDPLSDPHSLEME